MSFPKRYLSFWLSHYSMRICSTGCNIRYQDSLSPKNLSPDSLSRDSLSPSSLSPATVCPQTSLSPDQFVPETVCPQDSLSPKVYPRGQTILGTNCHWGQTVSGTNCLGDKLSRGQIGLGTNCLWGQTVSIFTIWSEISTASNKYWSLPQIFRNTVEVRLVRLVGLKLG